ncbi:MAG: DNA translocase FtsK [Rhizobium sp.]|nr:DNA translocase FtsK [Rhizobium sp.]
MQFPPFRIPVSNPSNVDSEAEQAHAVPRADAAGADARPPAQPVPDAVILDPEKLPVWQRAFILGPNVRFGRTPGPAVLKGEAAEAALQPGAASSGAPAGPVAPVSEAEIQAGSSANYVIGRSNPVFAPPAKVDGSPVGDLQRQIAEALSQGSEASDVRPTLSAEKHLASGLVLPPRTGAPLRVPPRAPREPLHAEVRPPIVRNPVKASAVAQPAAAVSQPPAARSAAIVPPTALTAPTHAPAAVAPVQVPARPANSQTPAASARPFTVIPDHLLWEMMSLGASEAAEPRAGSRVTRTPPMATPVPQPAPVVTAPTVAPVIATVVRMAPPSGSVAVPTPMPAPKVSSPTSNLSAVEAPSAVHLYRHVELRRPAQPTVPTPIVDTAPVVVETVEESTVSKAVVPADPAFVRSAARRAPGPLSFIQTEDYLFPSVELLQAPGPRQAGMMSQEALEQSAGLLESILEDFGVKGEIIDVRPGPVVTLYEFEPAPGVKSSRVINLSDDIARSMSALSARVAVVPGRNVIGIELPNAERETVFLRELIESNSYVGTEFRLPLCLGKTIGGEPVIAELAKMPHLLVAGTTGSGKSVAINTMILSLIYNLRPEECRLIMVDPKMLELSAYDGIPHLLTPVVTDPKKAVLALKWAVREMEERYRKMSRLGVRNIDGFNARVAEARARGETIMLPVPVGFDKGTGEQIFEDQELDLSALPYIVVIVDEMADLMMVAGKEIEGAIQRLAQMARAAGIHLIMATQRPSVDVITGTIKANFPTRISFQVTSKIDSRTILGEQGAEHLLGQGDMLHMVGGGRISRVHGPFVSDHEVEKVVAHLKTQGQPAYLGSVTEDTEEGVSEDEEDAAVFDSTAMGGEADADDLYERAVKVVQRDKKCSTSYIQRRLSIGYNRAASLVERMEQEGLVGAPNHVGKREILGQRSPAAKESEEQVG